MGKISKNGGASVRVFERPRTAADVLRSRGKLGPYGAKVETFQHPGSDAPAEVAETATDDPAAADVRAWARAQGIAVSARGKLPAELVDEYRAAQAETAAAAAVGEPTPVQEG